MRTTLFISILIICISCSDREQIPDQTEVKQLSQQIVVPEFQSIIDSVRVDGAVLIYDMESDVFYSNDFEWAKRGKLPASTFKIPNSIIALESGVAHSDTTLFKWDGEKRRLKIWEQDLTLQQAFHFSCVPCYQDVARNIGVKNMNAYLNSLGYGNMQVDSSNIDMFWLEGESRINQFEQIDFLKRFYQSALPISKRTEEIMKRLMIIDETDQFKLSGKTGWSIRNGNNNGWFVGYLEASNNTYIFATNVEPKQQFDMNMFQMIRKEVTFEAFRKLDIIN